MVFETGRLKAGLPSRSASSAASLTFETGRRGYASSTPRHCSNAYSFHFQILTTQTWRPDYCVGACAPVRLLVFERSSAWAEWRQMPPLSDLAVPRRV